MLISRFNFYLSLSLLKSLSRFLPFFLVISVSFSFLSLLLPGFPLLPVNSLGVSQAHGANGPSVEAALEGDDVGLARSVTRELDGGFDGLSATKQVKC